ncbi:hypothetical protein KI387_017180 [Taxus chinensis]|uniref:Uncharacterized protein n=1 Tax=Taxus chinensis TaxID=29808 RepID=A0AA38GFZ9_TAXCH|nr:hypothetical protein KI387_017180 [Taxus chinensis]
MNKYSKKEVPKEPSSASSMMQQQYLQQRNVKTENTEVSNGLGVGFTNSPQFGSPNGHALVASLAVEKSEYHDIKSGPLSPNSCAVPLDSPLRISCLNPRAEALAEAHRGRVEAEATAYFESEIRKLEAKAQKLRAKAERQRMHEEAKALEARKREDVRAEQLLQNAEVKAEKILSKAREDAQRIKAHACEHTEKSIAEAHTRAERWKAEIEETKKKDLAEITERVHMMIAIGELPSAQHNKGVVTRMKQSWSCRP